MLTAAMGGCSRCVRLRCPAPVLRWCRQLSGMRPTACSPSLKPQPPSRPDPTRHPAENPTEAAPPSRSRPATTPSFPVIPARLPKAVHAEHQTTRQGNRGRPPRKSRLTKSCRWPRVQLWTGLTDQPKLRLPRKKVRIPHTFPLSTDRTPQPQIPPKTPPLNPERPTTPTVQAAKTCRLKQKTA